MKFVLLVLGFAIATVLVIGCSDDGVYTPVEQEDPPGSFACAEKAGCPDASDDAGEMADGAIPLLDASK